jgi:oxygen-independent coproporphyrinogen-3 oxidase
MLSGSPVCSTEVLSEKDKLNDYIITGIRTKWGISIDYIREKFGDFLADRVIRSALAYESKALVKIIQGVITLTQRGILVSDQITLDFLFL